MAPAIVTPAGIVVGRGGWGGGGGGAIVVVGGVVVVVGGGTVVVVPVVVPVAVCPIADGLAARSNADSRPAAPHPKSRRNSDPRFTVVSLARPRNCR
jgi:hypothetical protein